MTNREFTSEVTNDLRALNTDQTISKEFILSKAWNIAKTLVKQESDNRRLFRMMELFTFVDCVELEPAPVTKCCDFYLPLTSFTRTKQPLSELYSTTYGVILRAFTLNNRKEFTFITPHEYQYTLHRTYKDKSKGYFWLQDSYLVIPDEFVDRINFSGMFLQPMEAKKLSSNISTPQPTDGYCAGPLDDTFICPGYLYNIVRQETVKDLYGFMMKGMSVEDQRPDGRENDK